MQGRAKMLKLLQEDMERRRQQIVEDRTLQERLNSQAEADKKERSVSQATSLHHSQGKQGKLWNHLWPI